MRYNALTILLASLASVAFADVKFTKPVAGSDHDAATTLTIVFEESGTAPLISTFESYTLFLMAGGNSAAEYAQLDTLVATGSFSDSYTLSETITVGAGADSTNGYFLMMMSISKEGGEIYNFSDRFGLTGMTGTFSATVTAGITDAGTSTAGPATVNDITTDTTTTAAADDSDEASLSYQLQTGLTKYAAMQPVPPTKITAVSYTPLYPTSAYTLATTYMATPSIVTTVTASQTFSVSSIENTIAAAADPTDDMAKFLRRWQD